MASRRRVNFWGAIARLVVAVPLIATAGLGSIAAAAQPDAIDRELAQVVHTLGLRPLDPPRFVPDAKFKLGQALFFDPVLSGPRVVSCATCHLLKYGTSDGLARSIGVHKEAADGSRGHRRNALDLWNRDHSSVRALFWDGRVEALDPSRGAFRSPLGRDLPAGLDNVLAAQALFPLAMPDEMLGDPGDTSPPDLPGGHGGLANDLASPSPQPSESARITDTHGRLMRRLLGGAGQPRTAWQDRYRALFREAYPGKTRFTIVDLANAIAHFEGLAFATRESAWDRYLKGDPAALSTDARRGAVIFYGKGRCATCHAGPLLSDFQYHAVAVFEGDPRPTVPEDLGRREATGLEADRYKFRTPPLRNVAATAPYFHDGSEPTLRGAIERHGDLKTAPGQANRPSAATLNAQRQAVSPILLSRPPLTAGELDALLAFLSALAFVPPARAALAPEEVPSGLPLVYK